MSTTDDGEDILPANDDQSPIDHLLAAYAQTKDPFGKYLIGLALIHEGKILANEIPLEVSEIISAMTDAKRTICASPKG